MDHAPHLSVSRRQAVGLVGLGVTAAVTPAMAGGTAPSANVPRNNEALMDDPRTKYPKPPFRPQTQPWPGLAKDMEPSADLYDYAQTKAATMNYVKSLAKQLAVKGIRVNGVFTTGNIYGAGGGQGQP